MHLIQISLVFFCCVSILTGSVFAQTEKEAEEMFNLVNAHFGNGDYDEAIGFMTIF